jgi:6-phosphogluconolactonase (cycloisomerase 2 family)
MGLRILTISAAVAMSMTGTAAASAATGDLTFTNCLQGPGATGPCAVSKLVDHPTDLNETGVLGVTSAASNTVAVIGANLTSSGCYDDGGSGCTLHTGPAIEDPEGLASVSEFQAYVAGDAHDSIAEVFGTDPRTARCIAQDGALGCAVAHGLHHPTRMALTPDATQLYAATGDGVAWFDVSKTTAQGVLTFAGCLAGDGADGCTPAAAIGHEQAIAISPDGSTVYVGSVSGTIVGFHRAADGSLSQVTCVTDGPIAPSPCTPVAGLSSVDAIAISPDGRSLYAASALGGGSLDTFARAADGTLGQTGCLSGQTLAGCTQDADVSTADSVAVSPDGENVYVGDTQSDAMTFDRAADGSLAAAGCIGATGGACIHGATVTDPTGAIVVSSDGQRVWVASVDHDGLTQFARQPAVANLKLEFIRGMSTAQVKRLQVRITNVGPAPATGIGFFGGLIHDATDVNPVVRLDSAVSQLGPCTQQLLMYDPEDAPLEPVCPVPDLPVGASTTAFLTFDNGLLAGTPPSKRFFGTKPVDITVREAPYLSDQASTPGIATNDGTTITFTKPRLVLGRVHVTALRGHRRGIAFTLSAAGHVTLRLRPTSGSGRAVTLHRAAHAGANTIPLAPLALGRYRATVIAAAGGYRPAAPRHLVFALVR